MVKRNHKINEIIEKYEYFFMKIGIKLLKLLFQLLIKFVVTFYLDHSAKASVCSLHWLYVEFYNRFGNPWNLKTLVIIGYYVQMFAARY